MASVSGHHCGPRTAVETFSSHRSLECRPGELLTHPEDPGARVQIRPGHNSSRRRKLQTQPGKLRAHVRNCQEEVWRREERGTVNFKRGDAGFIIRNLGFSHGPESFPRSSPSQWPGHRNELDCSPRLSHGCRHEGHLCFLIPHTW